MLWRDSGNVENSKLKLMQLKYQFEELKLSALQHCLELLAVLFVRSVQGGVTAGVEGGGALGLHGCAEAVLEDGLALCLIHSGAMF